MHVQHKNLWRRKDALKCSSSETGMNKTYNFLVNGFSDASNIGHKAVSHTLDTSSNSLTQQHIRLVGFLLISLPHHFTRIERTGTVKGCASCKYLKHLTHAHRRNQGLMICCGAVISGNKGAILTFSGLICKRESTTRSCLLPLSEWKPSPHLFLYYFSL